jgi:hypothetical protein
LFGIIFYTVDASNTLFIESDTSGQVAVGTFQAQGSGAQAAAAAHPMSVHPVVLLRPSVRRPNNTGARAK